LYTKETRAVNPTIRILGPADVSVLDHAASGVFDHTIDPRWTAEFLGDARHHLAVAIDEGQVVGIGSAVHYVHPDKPLVGEFERGGLGRFEVIGLERMRMRSEHPACIRLASPKLALAAGGGPWSPRGIDLFHRRTRASRPGRTSTEDGHRARWPAPRDPSRPAFDRRVDRVRIEK
jgi:hypothetical protein